MQRASPHESRLAQTHPLPWEGLSESPRMENVLVLPVDGMTCGHCSSRITQSLKSVDGVGQLNVDHITGTATIGGEPLVNECITAIEDCGFSVPAERYVDLPVEGMTCGHCVSRIFKGFATNDQVESAFVSLGQKRVVLIGITNKEAKQIIEDSGFEVPTVKKRSQSMLPHRVVMPDEIRLAEFGADQVANSKGKSPDTTAHVIKKSTFRITGMTCGACVSTVERYLRRSEAIKEVSVALLSEKAEVLYYADVLDESDIVNKIKDAGYGARVLEEMGNGVTKFVIADLFDRDTDSIAEIFGKHK